MAGPGQGIAISFNLATINSSINASDTAVFAIPALGDLVDSDPLVNRFVQQQAINDQYLLQLIQTLQALIYAGPTQQNNVTSERSFGVVYHNATSKPIFVTVTTGYVSSTEAVNAGACVGTTNPPTSEVVGTIFNSNAAEIPISFVVPPGYYYEVVNYQNASIAIWTEWT
jgi:hypothetical protein